jgi:hypothetical protein
MNETTQKRFDCEATVSTVPLISHSHSHLWVASYHHHRAGGTDSSIVFVGSLKPFLQLNSTIRRPTSLPHTRLRYWQRTRQIPHIGCTRRAHWQHASTTSVLSTNRNSSSPFPSVLVFLPRHNIISVTWYSASPSRLVHI